MCGLSYIEVQEGFIVLREASSFPHSCSCEKHQSAPFMFLPRYSYNCARLGNMVCYYDNYFIEVKSLGQSIYKQILVMLKC